MIFVVVSFHGLHYNSTLPGHLALSFNKLHGKRTFQTLVASKDFHVFYGATISIIAFIKAHHWPIPQASWNLVKAVSLFNIDFDIIHPL